MDCEGRESKGSIYPSVVDFGKGLMWEYAGECAGSLLKLRLCTDCGWQENVFWSADSPSWGREKVAPLEAMTGTHDKTVTMTPNI